MVYITNPYQKKKHIHEAVLMPNSVKSSRPIVTGGGYEEVKESKEDKIKKRNTVNINLAPPKNETPKEAMDKTTQEKLAKFISLKIL